MRRLIRVFAVLATSGLLVGSLLAGVADAAEHSPETCVDWQNSLSRMVTCVSVHHATGQAVPHVRTHTYKWRTGTGWVDMVADSQSLNAWDIHTNTGFRVYQTPQSLGGVSLHTWHGTGWVSLKCSGSEPHWAEAIVVTVSYRHENGTPYGPHTINAQTGYSPRPGC
jgi:hypothetical protein